MLNNIKFCLLMTISKVLAAFVTSFVILAIPMVIGMIALGQEYHGFSHLQIIGSFLACVILTPLCAQLARVCFRCALDMVDVTVSKK